MSGTTLHQGLIVHADGRFVADLEVGGTVVRSLRLAQSSAAARAGWRDFTGKFVLPGPIVLRRTVAAAGGWEAATAVHGPPATTVATVLRGGVAMAAAPGPRPVAVDAVPVPLLAGVEGELDSLPEAVFGSGCAAFAVDDTVFEESSLEQLEVLVRVLGHCGATLVVLSDRRRTMEAGLGGLPAPLDGCRVLLAPAGAAGMRRAVATARCSGGPGSGVAVAVPAEVLLDPGEAAAEWWLEVRAGVVAAVSVGAAVGTQLAARLWWAGVAAGRVTLEELAALLCRQPAWLFGLPAKGRLYPGCDADLMVLDPEAESGGGGPEVAAAGHPERPRGAVALVLRGGADAATRPGRWIGATPVREPM